MAPRGVPHGISAGWSAAQFAIFTDVSIPSPAMIAYAALYSKKARRSKTRFAEVTASTIPAFRVICGALSVP